MLIINKVSEDSDAVMFDYDATHQSQKRAFVTSPEDIFAFLLILFRKNLGLTQEQMGAVLTHKKPYSKTGYAKLERAETSINIQIIFDLSYLTGINFSSILTMYNHLLHVIANSKDEVIFHKMCGHYGLGNSGGYMTFKNIGTIKETYATKLKNYIDIVGQTNIDLINNTINENMIEEMKGAIKFRAECIVNSMKYPIEKEQL